jgi:plastocyanin
VFYRRAFLVLAAISLSAVLTSGPSALARPPQGHLKDAHVAIVTDPNTVGAYKPKTITVHLGQQIIFKNSSDAVHTVTSDANKAFDSKDIAVGKSWKFTAKKVGVFTYHCTYHPFMHGKIVVKR